MQAMRWIAICAWVMLAGPLFALPGDLNHDGRVNFDDFFLFTDNFGQEGEVQADTVVVEVFDTTRVTLRDTIITARTIFDTTAIIVPDTVRLSIFDTTRVRLTLFDTVTVNDTVRVEFVKPPADVPQTSRTIDRLEGIRLSVGFSDFNSDTRVDGLRLDFNFYIGTGDPFSPQEYSYFNGIWMEASYTITYERATGEPASFVIHEGHHTFSDWLDSDFELLNRDVLNLDERAAFLNSNGYMIFEAVVRTPEQGDYYAREEYLVEFDVNGNWRPTNAYVSSR